MSRSAPRSERRRSTLRPIAHRLLWGDPAGRSALAWGLWTFGHLQMIGAILTLAAALDELEIGPLLVFLGAVPATAILLAMALAGDPWLPLLTAAAAAFATRFGFGGDLVLPVAVAIFTASALCTALRGALAHPATGAASRSAPRR